MKMGILLKIIYPLSVGTVLSVRGLAVIRNTDFKALNILLRVRRKIINERD